MSVKVKTRVKAGGDSRHTNDSHHDDDGALEGAIASVTLLVLHGGLLVLSKADERRELN